ncbi:unnamed protein product [Closterium sp. NIES-53]
MAKRPLDEVVMDVVGPLKLGAAGFDVYTCMTWVYVRSKKSDVDETVKTEWLPMVERQQDPLVKSISTDQGGEFLSKDFSLWRAAWEGEEIMFGACGAAFGAEQQQHHHKAISSCELGRAARNREEDGEEVPQGWKKAMVSELKSIEENGTWDLVELPEGHKAITSEWLFKIKSDADDKIERYKSRIVSKGYQQKENVDYKELFAFVVKPTTL